MSQPVLTLQMPAELYEHVRRAAKGMKEPVERALVKIVQAATPSLEKVPLAYRADLQAMEDLADDELWQMAETRLAPAKQRRLGSLLGKNVRGELTGREQATLRDLRTDADRLMLQRAYAFLLLKYRGHSVPAIKDWKQ
jgi:hypothetical protein